MTASRHSCPVVFGTPLSPSAVRVMLLGAGELGKEVIIALQRLGVETIAVDRYANAPGMQVAHRAHVVTMTDGPALRALIETEKPHIIVPEIEAIATGTLQEIEEEGLARVIPAARATRLTMDREGIRRLAAEKLGLPVSPYAFAGSQEELRAAIGCGIGYPCLVKPTMSSSGKGQSVVRGPEDVARAWEYAMQGGRVTVRAIGESGETETFFCEPVGHVQCDGDYVESWQPQAMSGPALEKARAIAGAITGDLGGLGLFGVELFVKGDQVWFSEVSPRPHDTGLVTLASQRLSEFELHARAILGLPVDVSLRSPGASAVIYGGIAAEGIAFDGVTDALAVPGVDLRLFGKPESFVKRRMGVAISVGADVEEARKRAKLAASRVKPRPGESVR